MSPAFQLSEAASTTTSSAFPSKVTSKATSKTREIVQQHQINNIQQHVQMKLAKLAKSMPTSSENIDTNGKHKGINEKTAVDDPQAESKISRLCHLQPKSKAECLPFRFQKTKTSTWILPNRLHNRHTTTNR